MRRLIVAALAAASVITVGAAFAAPGAQALVVGHARLAIDSAATFPSYTTTASREQVVVLQAWDTSQLQALKAANPNVKVLMYEDSSAASSSVGPNGLYSSGVSYNQASANGWLLLNTSGQPFTYSCCSWLWAADIGLSAYQNAWVQDVLNQMGSYPWDGVFLDDVNPTIQYGYCVTCVAKYPSDAAYGAAMTSFVQNVGAQLQAAGKLAIANIGSWPNYSSVTNGWLQYLSGGMDQQFLKWGTTPGTGYQSPDTWAAQLAELKLAESEGKLFIGVTNSANTDEGAAVYGYATELLGGAGHSLFYMGADWTNETWFPEYDYAIGDPLGPESVDANGVHRRVFANGLVLVNPTTSLQTVSLGGGATYSGSGLTSVSTVTMAPQTGLVLVPDASSQTTVAPPAVTSAPTISGTAVKGQTLTGGAGTWTGIPTPTYSYQWSRCSTTSVSSCVAISGATASTYAVQSADVGFYLDLTVTASNSGGTRSATSATTAQVPTPTFSLSASPTSQQVKRGHSVAYTIYVNAQNGWSGPVSLSAAGLPAGSTASFSSSSTSSSATLTVRTSSSSVGSWTMTVSGTAGGTTRSTSLKLAVK
jgi:hypothetical protein